VFECFGGVGRTGWITGGSNAGSAGSASWGGRAGSDGGNGDEDVMS